MTDEEKLKHAFVQGAAWWEWYRTQFTMWTEDKHRAYERATELAAAGTLGLSDEQRLQRHIDDERAG